MTDEVEPSQFPLVRAPARLKLVRESRVVSPPDMFGAVEQGLYRSSLPQTSNLSHLRVLRLRSVVVLSPQQPTRTVRNFFDEQSIELFHTGASNWVHPGSWKPVSDEAIKQSLEIVLDKRYLPALLCDVGGLHLVGVVVGVLRRLQQWNLNSIVDEYRAFAGTKTRYNNEQFIELYDVDLVRIPNTPPEWFQHQMDSEVGEQAEFRRLCESGALDDDGALRERKGQYGFKIFYFSSTGPLHSVHGAAKPRIQRL